MLFRSLVQTNDPESELIELASAQDYDSFFDTEIATRRLMVYPPYCDLVQVALTADSMQAAKTAAAEFFDRLKAALSEQPEIKIIVLGPSPASVVKVSLKYRFRLILKVKNTARFRALMQLGLQEFYQSAGKNVSVTVDINPENII